MPNHTLHLTAFRPSCYRCAGDVRCSVTYFQSRPVFRAGAVAILRHAHQAVKNGCGFECKAKQAQDSSSHHPKRESSDEKTRANACYQSLSWVFPYALFRGCHHFHAAGTNICFRALHTRNFAWGWRIGRILQKHCRQTTWFQCTLDA